MENLLERVACHTDIDTRRAMGFGPRKLPPSNLVNLTDKYNVMKGCKYTMISHHPELQWMGDVLYGARHKRVKPL
jgi:pyruvate/oxaloacetate carboxyltransferase